MPDDVDVLDVDTDKEAKRARKRQKQADLLAALQRSGTTFTGFVDEDDEDRMKRIIADAAKTAVTSALEEDAKRVDPKDRPNHGKVEDKVADDADPRSLLPDALKAVDTVKLGDKVVSKKVKLPLSPGGMRGHSVEADRILDEHIANALVKSINVNKFPRNFDAGDFCVSRYCLAREMFPYEGQRAFAKYAPKESAYYDALEDYGKEFKALGEFTSGQDGGFLAPEIWTNVFFDISGVAVW